MVGVSEVDDKVSTDFFGSNKATELRRTGFRAFIVGVGKYCGWIDANPVDEHIKSVYIGY